MFHCAAKITVTHTGSGLDQAIKKVKLYLDTNSGGDPLLGDGIFNFTIDTLVTETTFPPGETRLAAINIPSPFGVNGTIGTSTKTYYIVYDFDATAEPNQTHGAQLSGSNIVPVAGNGSPPSFLVIASTQITVNATPLMPTTISGARDAASRRRIPWPSPPSCSLGPGSGRKAPRDFSFRRASAFHCVTASRACSKSTI